MTAYTKVISLGAWCQVAEQLRLHEVPRTLSPFEWTVATWSALRAVLEDDGAKLCQDVRPSADGKQFLCQNYGLLHPHDFPHSEAHGEEAVSQPSAEELAIAQGKYAHKMRVFRDACRDETQRICFLRMGGEAEPAFPWPYLHDRTPLTVKKINDLVQLLKTYCGHDHFDLVILLHHEWHPVVEDVALDPQARVIILDPPAPGVDWYGFRDVWTEIYQKIGIDVAA